MFGDLKRLGKETFIYGISTVVARLLNFILLPLYTHYLHPDEYGVVATVFSFIAFLNVVYSLGLNQGYIRYFKEKNSLKNILSFIFFSSFILSFLVISFSKPLAYIFQVGIENYRLIIYSAVILYFDSIILIPFTDLRMKHKALIFVFVKIFAIVLNIILNVIFLKYMRTGIDGVFTANVISSFSQFILFIKYIRLVTFSLDFKFLKEVFRYSFPFVPSSLSGLFIQLIDRPIMMSLISPYWVGIYQANFRIAVLLNLFVSMFDFAFRPFVIENMNKENATEIFSRIFKYFTYFLVSAWLFLSFFVEDIVKINVFGSYLISPNYWSGLGTVPVIMLGYLLGGVYINFMVSVIVTKKSYYSMIVNIISAVISIVLNFLLVPSLGIYGASLSFLISYLVLSTSMYFITKKIYPVKYDFKRFFSVLFFALILYSLPNYVFPEVKMECTYFQLKIFIFLVFLFFTLIFGYFTREELESFRSWLKSYF